MVVYVQDYAIATVLQSFTLKMKWRVSLLQINALVYAVNNFPESTPKRWSLISQLVCLTGLGNVEPKSGEESNRHVEVYDHSNLKGTFIS